MIRPQHDLDQTPQSDTAARPRSLSLCLSDNCLCSQAFLFHTVSASDFRRTHSAPENDKNVHNTGVKTVDAMSSTPKQIFEFVFVFFLSLSHCSDAFIGTIVHFLGAGDKKTQDISNAQNVIMFSKQNHKRVFKDNTVTKTSTLQAAENRQRSFLFQRKNVKA